MRGKDDIAEDIFVEWMKKAVHLADSPVSSVYALTSAAKTAYAAADALHRVREERREEAAAEYRRTHPDAPPRPKP